MLNYVILSKVCGHQANHTHMCFLNIPLYYTFRAPFTVLDNSRQLCSLNFLAIVWGIVLAQIWV